MNEVASQEQFRVDNADDRKSAALAAKRVKPPAGAEVISHFSVARQFLRSPNALQDGMGADEIPMVKPEEVSVFFLDGEIHRQRRAELARYFTPKAIKERHQRVMQETTAELMAELRKAGEGRLDLMSLRLASDVAAEIVGLTSSNPRHMAARLQKVFTAMNHAGKAGGIGGAIAKAKQAVQVLLYFQFHVKPAIAERRRQPKDDIISYCLEHGYSDKAILVECMTYATAGMLTTREFIVMVCWHLFERADLRKVFLDGDERAQIRVLEEILRLEPVAAMIYRKATQTFTTKGGVQLNAGQSYAIDLRAANVDEAETGPCPLAVNPDRSLEQRANGSWMSFGDGPHRCPGSQVALHETRVFVDALLRVPGIALAKPPKLGWADTINGYELHGAIVTCDKA